MMDTQKRQLPDTQTAHVKNDDASTAVLGVSVGDDRYLILMTEVNEVIPIPKLGRVPLTQPWFLGLANVRGNLYGITDLRVYLGGDFVPFNLKSRILLASLDNKVFGGFIVNNMLGIRNLSDFTPVEPGKKELTPGVTAHHQDAEGRLWRQLSLLELLHDEKFLHIAAD
ncbi:chemotaxis protein CheW [Nitrosomonas sp. JL21]|uniref:chemotaxis protein CheW n=1 Tax=Nitrosomonas sp. JL21 TaxID=153949 RepID=UPI001F042805|nr:chemotaxis protein CheW [Nitrosomonas sp. JL21]